MLLFVTDEDREIDRGKEGWSMRKGDGIGRVKVRERTIEREREVVVI
jgi:hypothetical protein